jgi:PAS domain S-box-containing protein
MHKIIPDISYESIVKLEFLSFYAAIPLSVMFIRSLFPEDMPVYFQRAAQAFGLLLSLIVIFFSPGIFTRTLQAYQTFTVLVSLYLIYVIVRAMIKKRPGSVIFFTGFIVIVACIVNDILIANMMINSILLIPAGLFAFALSQAVLLSTRISSSFSMTEHTSLELERRISDSTQELRRSEEMYRLLIENATDIVTIIDTAAVFRYLSPSAERILGHGQEMVGRNYLTELVPQEYRKQLIEFYSKQIIKRIPETNIKIPVYNKNREIRWLEMNSRLVEHEDGQRLFYGISRDITDKKSAEEAIRISEERYRSILDSNRTSYFEIDIKGNITFCNDVLLDIMGYSRDEMIGSSFKNFVPESSQKSIFEAYKKIFLGEVVSLQIEHDIICRDNTLKYLDSTVSLHRGPENSVQGFRCLAIDITDRKTAQEALAVSESRMRRIFENVEDIVYICDLKANLLWVSPSFFRDPWGYKEADVINTNILDYMPEESRRQVIKYHADQQQLGIELLQYEYRMMTSDGTIMHLGNSVRMIKDETGTVLYYGVARDITGQKKSEDALRSSEEKYRNILASINEGYYEVSLDGNFTFGNDSMCDILGYSRDELMGLNYAKLMDAENRKEIYNVFNNIFATGDPSGIFNWRFTKRDGKKRIAQCTASLITNLAGKKTGFRGMLRDMTDLVAAQEAHRELEEQKNRFFANVSHEIRTPLTLMLSPIESYLQGDYKKEIGKDFFENLYRNGLRLLKLINNLLDFSKIEAGRMTMKVVEIDIVKFISSYVASLQSACDSRGVLLWFTPGDKIQNLYADIEKLDKIFMNLLSNALKFTDAGGAITIRLSADEKMCRIEIEDTGQGIPAEYIDRIFERFGQADTAATRKHEGTGIGLALAKELVEMHSGRIKAASRYIEEDSQNHGSVFTVELPLGREHFENNENISFYIPGALESSFSDKRFSGMREMGDLKESAAAGAVPDKDAAAPIIIPETAPLILVVDDNPDMREFLIGLMSGSYSIITAENGRQGLEKISEHSPDLIITDVMMPEMDGYEMTRLIKENDSLKQIPVIMLTAKAEISQKIEGLEHGADDYLIKPFNSKELLTRIKSLLKTREYEKEIARRNREIEEEMEVARLLQQRLLPEKIAGLSGYDYHAVYIPMDKVGGDFYDITMNAGSIDLFIADVSGHGLPGAFLAMMTKMALESFTDRKPPGETLYHLNEVIHRATVKSNYVTAFYCSVDTAEDNLTYSSAGHIPALLYRGETGEFIELQTKGKPLGWFSGIMFEEKKIQIFKGDRIILYTDGITECPDPQFELFGEDRLISLIKENSSLKPQALSEVILSSLKTYSGSEKFDDDLTMLIFDVL